MRAVYFRLCFMLQVGGLYIDADDENQGADVEPLITGGLLRLQPLVYDIPSDSMVNVARALEAIGEAERIFYVNNNPIVAGPGHPVNAAAFGRATVFAHGTDADAIRRIFVINLDRRRDRWRRVRRELDRFQDRNGERLSAVARRFSAVDARYMETTHDPATLIPTFTLADQLT